MKNAKIKFLRRQRDKGTINCVKPQLPSPTNLKSSLQNTQRSCSLFLSETKCSMFRNLRYRFPYGFPRKETFRLKVTFNGPFVEYPKCHTSAALNGEVHFDMPQSGSICIKPYSLSCVEGDLWSISTQFSYANGHVYQKVLLRTPSLIIADQGSSVSAKAFQIDAPKNWQVNGLKNIFSWSSVSFDRPNEIGLVRVEGAGFFSLSGDHTILELEKDESISLLRLKFVATNGLVLRSDLLAQANGSIFTFTASKAYSWYRDTLGPVLRRIPYQRLFKQKLPLNKTNSRATPVNLTQTDLSDVKVTGPGVVILNNA